MSAEAHTAARRPDFAPALLRRGWADAEGLERAGRQRGEPLERALNRLGLLSDERVADLYAEASGLPRWRGREPAPGLFSRQVAPAFLRLHAIAPLGESAQGPRAAISDPFDRLALQGLGFALGARPQLWIAGAAECKAALEEVFPTQSGQLGEGEEGDLAAEAERDGPAARLVARALARAVALGASDIHFEPHRGGLSLRLRLDGALREVERAPLTIAGNVAARVKVLANLDLGERRLPQDGRFSALAEGRTVDVRVAISPTLFGESVVLRLLNRTPAALDLAALGFAAPERAVLERAVERRHGLFLVTGPTGSGKTTTLYACLSLLKGSRRKILTIEDPVEVEFEHACQTQAAPHLGLTFAAALRAFLRQDPDVILVGEIRDAETAQIAVQAALTGHLVLASLHANSALKAIPRLLDMGVEPYQLAAALLGVQAQRLAPRLCAVCAQPSVLGGEQQALLRLPAGAGVRRAAGCAACSGEGVRGRVVLAEAFLCADAMSAAIAARAPADALERLAAETGFRALLQDGAEKTAAGVISPEAALAAALI
jgi:type II secretory ATPase GspE/PulE/Tfp pilus assembly ATPase PilB-like protein